MEKPVIYTVGHSTHQLDYFIKLLQEYSVNCLVDVRSVPASSYNPQYNKEPLSNFLKKNGITYLHFAKNSEQDIQTPIYWMMKVRWILKKLENPGILRMELNVFGWVLIRDVLLP
ncbi:MAG: DUF488 domain-containing protein [Bacteroidota bacterium]